MRGLPYYYYEPDEESDDSYSWQSWSSESEDEQIFEPIINNKFTRTENNEEIITHLDKSKFKEHHSCLRKIKDRKPYKNSKTKYRDNRKHSKILSSKK